MLRVLCVLALAAIGSVANAGVMVSASMKIVGLKIVNANTGVVLNPTQYTFTPGVPVVSASNGINGNAGINGPTGTIMTNPGVTAETFASLNIDDLFAGLTDDAFFSLTTSATLTGNTNTFIPVKAVFTVETTLSVVDSGTPGLPVNGFGIAQNSLTFGIETTAGSIPSQTNPTTIIVSPSPIYNDTLTGNGLVTTSNSYETNVFGLINTTNVTLTATQVSSASFQTASGAVPEPISLAIFGAVGLAGFVGNRRRKNEVISA